MKIVCLLLLAFCTVSLAGKTYVCKGKRKGKLQMFNGRSIDVKLPCKYYALKRQQCGGFHFTLSPGNIWVGDNYYWRTIWLGVTNTTSKEKWEGRTTNKIVHKHLVSKGTKSLFNKKGGSLDSTIFKTGYVKDKYAYIEIDRVFRLTLRPWSLSEKKKDPKISWEFECLDENAELNNFTDGQVCGGTIKKEVETRVKEVFGLSKTYEEFVVYNDVFHSTVEQTDEECINASTLLTTCHDQSRQTEVLKNCYPILWNLKHARCITSYVCSPMEAFIHCLRWGCYGQTAFDRKARDLCRKVGDAIDLCPDIANSGNLTARLKEASCYNEYCHVNMNYTVASDGDED